MPILDSKYVAPLVFRNSHMNTIATNVLRNVRGVTYKRERIELDDGDFIDLDFSKVGGNKLVLILHGLEGNSQRVYARGLVKEANRNDLDAAVFNQRGCSGEPNRLLTSYHSGKSEDLQFVVEWLSANHNYETIYLAGISLGGNIVLKYLGELEEEVPSVIAKAATLSVPVDLYDSAIEMRKPKNSVYLYRLMNSLKSKANQKFDQFNTDHLNKPKVSGSREFVDFDEYFTAPVHGFDGAIDYYTKCSSIDRLNNIRRPSLLINALDDPFLGKGCYPVEQAGSSEYLFMETPSYGGHVGFAEGLLINSRTWSEKRMIRFLTDENV